MMNRNARQCFVIVTLAMVACAAVGCSTYRQEYPGHNPDQVWAAAMSVAQSPDYQGDWFVTENHVWLDDDWARMEIDREVRRLTNEPFTKATPEKRQWQFRVTMEGGDPVVLSFMNRNPTIPGWTLREAQRFFDEVSEMLMAVPAAGVGDQHMSSGADEEPPAQPEVKFEEPMDDADVDDESDDILDSLMDDGV